MRRADAGIFETVAVGALLVRGDQENVGSMASDGTELVMVISDW
jgi:hypothetical protein